MRTESDVAESERRTASLPRVDWMHRRLGEHRRTSHFVVRAPALKPERGMVAGRRAWVTPINMFPINGIEGIDQ